MFLCCCSHFHNLFEKNISKKVGKNFNKLKTNFCARVGVVAIYFTLYSSCTKFYLKFRNSRCRFLCQKQATQTLNNCNHRNVRFSIFNLWDATMIVAIDSLNSTDGASHKCTKEVFLPTKCI
jgi:hypothetical protein